VSGVYDVETLRGAYRDLVSSEVPPYPWTYPSTFFFLLAPLALLPPVAASWLWIGLTVAWLMAAVWRCIHWRMAPLLVMLFPAIAHAIVTGPTGTLTAALVASVAATFTSVPMMAGVFLALLTYKPHLAGLLPLCLLAGRNWRVVAVSVFAFSVLVAASLVVFGPTAWRLFFANVPAHSGLLADERLPWERMPTVFVALRHATGSVRLAGVVQALEVPEVAGRGSALSDDRSLPSRRLCASGVGIPARSAAAQRAETMRRPSRLCGCWSARGLTFFARRTR